MERHVVKMTDMTSISFRHSPQKMISWFWYIVRALHVSKNLKSNNPTCILKLRCKGKWRIILVRLVFVVGEPEDPTKQEALKHEAFQVHITHQLISCKRNFIGLSDVADRVSNEQWFRVAKINFTTWRALKRTKPEVTWTWLLFFDRW